MRVLRDRPEPLSMTTASPASALPLSSSAVRSANQACSVSRALSGVAVAFGEACNASVRKSCCAITLLLYLLMSRKSSASGGERISKLGLVCSGARPSCTVPRNSPPISRHSAASKRAS